MTAVIYDKTDGRIVKHFDTMRGAKISFTRKWSIFPELVVATYAEYQMTGGNLASEMVQVKTIYGNDVAIRRDQVGTACDPSTERYWSM